MQITTLIENRPNPADPRLACEWGLSLHIAFNGQSILFDAGSSGKFAQNAEILSCDLACVDVAVLSHHHYDHANGFRRFLEINTNARVYLGDAAGGECFGRHNRFPFLKKYVGPEKALLSDYADRFETVIEPVEILPDVFLFPCISGSYPRPANQRLLIRRGGRLAPDDFVHELVMAIKENNQLVVFTGCAHNGVLNMVDTAARGFAGMPVKAVIGGFHQVALPANDVEGKRQVEGLARLLLDYPVGQTYTVHCTGENAYAILKSVMGERITDLRTGSCFKV